MRPRPNSGVGGWLANVDEDCARLSVVASAEVRYGIEQLPQGSAASG
jgi:hypothetical protein